MDNSDWTKETNLIKRVRLKYNLTQEQLATALDLSREIINKMENDKAEISHKTMFKINAKYDVKEISPNSDFIYIEKERLLTLLETQLHVISSQQGTISNQQQTLHQLVATLPEKKVGG